MTMCFLQRFSLVQLVFLRNCMKVSRTPNRSRIQGSRGYAIVDISQAPRPPEGPLADKDEFASLIIFSCARSICTCVLSSCKFKVQTSRANAMPLWLMAWCTRPTRQLEFCCRFEEKGCPSLFTQVEVRGHCWIVCTSPANTARAP